MQWLAVQAAAQKVNVPFVEQPTARKTATADEIRKFFAR